MTSKIKDVFNSTIPSWLPLEDLETKGGMPGNKIIWTDIAKQVLNELEHIGLDKDSVDKIKAS